MSTFQLDITFSRANSTFNLFISPTAGKRSNTITVDFRSSWGFLYWPETIKGFSPSIFIMVFSICSKISLNFNLARLKSLFSNAVQAQLYASLLEAWECLTTQEVEPGTCIVERYSAD